MIMSNDLWRLSACQLAAGVRRGEFSSREVVEDYLERTNKPNGAINVLTKNSADKAWQHQQVA